MAVLSFPASPSNGTRYVSPNGDMYVYDGYSWNSSSEGINPNPRNNYFRYRTIYTRGYVHCGYQNSSPWRNTNRTVHLTDTTSNLGDMMDNIANYVNGGFSDYNTYMFPNAVAWNGASTFVSSMSMITETLRTSSSSRDLKVARQDTKTLMNPGLTAIYIAGGGSAVTEKFNTVTDSMMYQGSVPDCAAGIGGNTYRAYTGFFGEFKGTVGANGNSGSLDFSTETWTGSTWSFAGNLDGVAKGLSSKWGVAYNATTNVTGTTYKFNDTTLTQISSFGRAESCGEENMQIGQDWGYSLGSYNGAQTNNSYKQSYSVDAEVALGSAGQPKGHGGMSSGCCGTGSCVILGGIMGTSI